MKPEEAKARYEAEWPALNAAKESATTPQAAKKCRQALSALSARYAARFELNKAEPEEPPELYTADQLKAAKVEVLREAAKTFIPAGRYMAGTVGDTLRRMADELEKEK